MPAPSIWTDETAAQCRRLLEALVLDTGERWGDGGLQQWQRDAFAATLGLPGAPTEEKNLLWVEGPTGCGKDQIIAAATLASLRFAPDGYRVLNYSADYDRCKDVIETVRGFIQRTDERAEEKGIVRWLGNGIEILRDEIRHVVHGPEGKDEVRVTVHVESLDGFSASGSRADLYLMNEVQSWPSPHGERVWEEALARYDKLVHGRFVVFSNAPFSPPGDFRRDEREKAAAGGAESPWHFLGVRVEDCPWMTEEKLERKRRSLPPHVYRRLYECLPTDGRGELIPPEIYDAAVDPHRGARDQGEPGATHIHGIDIGVSRDHAVHLIAHRDPNDKMIHVDRVRVWVPPPKGQIDLARVEEEIAASLKAFPGRIYADPYQAVEMCQRFGREGISVTQVSFTPENLTKMAEAVRSAFVDHRIVLFPDAGYVRIDGHVTTSLRRQVLEAEVVESEKGSRIKSPRSKAGHGDQLSALALALFGITEVGLPCIVYAISSSQIDAMNGVPPRPTRPPLNFIHGDHGKSNRYRYVRRHGWRS